MNLNRRSKNESANNALQFGGKNTYFFNKDTGKKSSATFMKDLPKKI